MSPQDEDKPLLAKNTNNTNSSEIYEHVADYIVNKTTFGIYERAFLLKMAKQSLYANILTGCKEMKI
jgi:hypothetical protein